MVNDVLINNTDIERNGLPWCVVDTIEKCLKPYAPFVMNTTISSEQGIHWISCCLMNGWQSSPSKTSPSILWIYDSLGKNNYRPYDSLMKNTLKKHNIQLYLYDNKSQYDDSVWCGWYAILVCKKLQSFIKAHQGKINIQEANKIVDGLFSGDGRATPADEKMVMAHFGLKEPHFSKGDVEGQGLFDEIMRRLRGIKMALSGTRTNLKPSVRQYLQKIGNQLITKLKVCRRAVGPALLQVVKTINQIGGHVPPIPHDKLYHLFLVIAIQDGSVWMFEKVEDVNIEPFQPSPLDECIEIPLTSGLTINKMIDTTLKTIGNKSFFNYDALTTNCQRFIYDVLRSNNLLILPQLKDFILQDVSQLTPRWGQKLLYFITSLANRGKTIIQGEGVNDWFYSGTRRLT